MIFFLVYVFLMFGIIVAGIAGLMPYEMQDAIPDYWRFLLFFMGFLFSFIGIILVQTRATKTGAVHLLEYGRPGTIIWFYVFRDGTMKITPAMREVEGALYSRELDAQINDLKSYKLFDHSIRIVPEGLGHAVNLDMVLYATLVKKKYGYANIKEARKAVLGEERLEVGPFKGDNLIGET